MDLGDVRRLQRAGSAADGERRWAVVLARHYREFEGLAIR
jgi:hypothetical protein